MRDKDRYKLHFGPYKTPRFRYGKQVYCEVRGWVTIVGITTGKIPWPIGQVGSHKSLVVYKGLWKALQREANQAVAHWWAITGQTVTKWRRATGVGRTEGDIRLASAIGSQDSLIDRRLRKTWKKAKDPERCRKIAEARRGNTRPKHVIEAMRKANLGRRHSEEARRKMRAAQARNPQWPPAAGIPWTKKEEELLRTLSPAEVAKRTGRTLTAVYSYRSKLKLADARTLKERKKVGRS